MPNYCENCGELLIGYLAEEELCQECWGELEDYDDDSDIWDEDDEDNPFFLFDPYWAGDVPDPFDERAAKEQ